MTMVYRIVLYVLAALAYAFAQYFADKAPANAENIFEFWLVLFGFIMIEAGYRLRTSLYVLFPAGYLVAIILQYLEIGGGLVYQGIGAWLHTGLGAWVLVLRFHTFYRKTSGANILLAAGICCLVFGLNGINYFFEFTVLEQLLQFRLSSYILIASAGTFLLSDQPPRVFPALVPVFRLILIIHSFLLISRLMANFLS